MALHDIVITKLTKNLNRPAANQDKTCALVMGGVATSNDNTIALAEPILMYSIEDAESYGITAQYDEDNRVLVYHHIKEFFRLAPGQPLYVYLVAQTTPLEDICDQTNTVGVFDMLQKTLGAVRKVGVVLNPEVGYTPALTNGLNADVIAAIAKADQLAKTVYDLHKPVDVIVIEGRDFDPDTFGSAYDIKGNNDCEDVAVVLLQDLDVRELDTLYEGYAAVGTTLGKMASTVTVADSAAEVGVNSEGNLQSIADEAFLRYGYAGVPLATISNTNQGLINAKGYIVPREWPLTTGFYFATMNVCSAATNDIQTVEYNAVIAKAHREIYKAYTPYMNKKYPLTAAGKLQPYAIKDLEAIGNTVFTTMQANGEISAGATYIDPATIIVTTRKIVVKWNIVPLGYLEAIDGQLGFTITL